MAVWLAGLSVEQSAGLSCACNSTFKQGKINRVESIVQL
jgi:hypothetical protein